MKTLGDRSLGEYLDRLGKRRVSPCGGAAAALCGAQAAALSLMAARSVSGPPPTFADADLSEVEVCQALVTGFLQLMERDAEVVATLIGRYSLPRTTPESDAARSEAIEAALINALAVQAEMAPFAKRLARLISEVFPRTSPGLIADLAAAVELTRTALVIARLNVEANGALIIAPDFRIGSEAVLDMTSTLAFLEELAQTISEAGK
jgi:formiminotetrahydrofolate cyclodeaminase